MEIVWDELKREANLAKHELDFAALNEGFFRAARIAAVRSERYQALGRVGNRVVVVIFSRLGTEAFSVISMRPANKRERREL